MISSRTRRGGRAVIVYGEGENFSILDLLLVTEVEVQIGSSKARGKRKPG